MLAKVLTTVGIAAFVAALGHLLGWQPWRGEDGPENGGRGAALGIAGATAFAYAFLREGVPTFPPADANSWIFWFAGFAFAVVLIDTFVRKPFVVWPLRVVLVSAASYLAARPLLMHAWEGSAGTMKVAGFALVTLAVWAIVEARINRDESDPATPLGLGFAGAAAGGAIAYVASLTIGLVVSVLAVAIGASAVTGWWRRDVTYRDATGVFIPLFGLALLLAHGYADIDLLAIVLLGLAPVLVWVGAPLASKSLIVRSVATVIAVSIPGAIATPLAEQAANAALEESPGEPESAGSDGTEESDDGTYVPYGDEESTDGEADDDGTYVPY